MRAPEPIRVAHPFANFAKGWGIAYSATVVLTVASLTTYAHAQPSSCGLTSVTEKGQLIYPPIARAAHVQGHVVLKAKFDNDGTLTEVAVFSGPRMLWESALDYVKTWHANPSNAPRECPIEIEYVLGKEAAHPKVTVKRIDPQHVRIEHESPVTQSQHSTPRNQ